MKTDSIVQEVRDARAAIAAEFGYDLSKYLVWIRDQTRLRKEGASQANRVGTPEGIDRAAKPSAVRKRPAGVLK
jgi:hypothetical protein